MNAGDTLPRWAPHPAGGRVEFHLDRWFCAYFARTSCGRAGARPSHKRREGRVPPRPRLFRVPRPHVLRTRGSPCLPQPAGGSSSTSTAPFPRTPPARLADVPEPVPPPPGGRVEFHLDRAFSACPARTSCGRAEARPSHNRAGGSSSTSTAPFLRSIRGQRGW
jgi:hypothetical protein